MPRAFERDGFAVRVLGPPREHPPPHVHVQLGSHALVVIRLRLPNVAQRVWRIYDMRPRDVVRAFKLVELHHELLLQLWEDMHGETPDA